MVEQHMNGVAEPKRRRHPWIEHGFAWVWGRTHGMLEKTYGRRKEELFGGLAGRVLEIGAGTGINLRHYPKTVEVVALEPNPFMHPYLETSGRDSGLSLTIQDGVAEAIEADDNSYDAVVSTLVLCSVDSPEQVLAEVRRVLKPGGQFYFVEHVAAPAGSGLRRFQNTVQPLWTCLGDGCRPNRETHHYLEQAGFSTLDFEHTRVDIPVFPVRPHIIGTATK